MQKKELFVSNNKIHVVSYYPETQKHETSIILVHGSWGAGWMWGKYVEFLTSEGWLVHSLDLRGHGESGGSIEGLAMQDYVNDIDTVVVELEIKKPIVIGHSMGGLLVLMYGAQHPTSGVISIDGSPTREVKGESLELTYKKSYTIVDAGMPTDPNEVMKIFPDLSQDQLMMMKDMFGKESGLARSERKLGISVPREKLTAPLLFLGAELGESVVFGIGIKTSQKMSDYYGGKVVEVKGATHPGILLGTHADNGMKAIEEWVRQLGSMK